MTFQVIYATDGTRAFAFYHYKNEGMLLSGGTQFIGTLIDGYAEGFEDSADGSYLRRPDLNIQSSLRTFHLIACDLHI